MARTGLYGGGSAQELYDFRDEPTIIELTRQFTLVASNVGTNELPVTNGGIARAYFRVPRAGIVTGLNVVAEDAMVQHSSNFLTFTALNLQVAGSGNRSLLDVTAHVNTTDTNAVALNTGSDLTAKVIWALALSATTAALYVKEGDLIEVTATGSGTPAAVDCPHAILQIRSLPPGLKPTVTHTAGATTNVPIAIQNLSTAAGSALLQLSATSEVQVVRLDRGDQLLTDPTMTPSFSCRLKISAVSAVSRMVWGLASAYVSTLDSIVSNAWFKLDGNSLVMITETDDGTTDSDDQVSGVTLVADTYYVFSIDFNSDLTKIKFSVNGVQCTTVHSAPLLSASTLLQPFIAIQKDSGTGTGAVTVDWVSIEQAR